MHQSLELFRERLAEKPYCTNDPKKGLKILPSNVAAYKKYIQPNKPNSINCLVFDIDRPISPDEITDVLLLPPPSIFVQDRESCRAHILYLLNAPVHNNSNSSKKALAYLRKIHQSYAFALGADPRYAGLICKNPLSTEWRVYANETAYDLDELAEYIDEETWKISTKIAKGSYDSTSRNCDLFGRLRVWAYANVDRFRAIGPFNTWRDAVRSKAEEMNSYSPSLAPSELDSITKSVTGWTWKKYTGRGSKCDPEYSELQRSRGECGGRPSLGEPWKRDGISRATWYRRKTGIVSQDMSCRGGSNKEQLISQVKALRCDGCSQSKIASILHISQQHVSRLLAA